ncbi:polyhydroxyalkanoate synthesis repressor PhaR [Marinicauda salina]|uniref:Polyhydroxyalkanoate synthesis repressor PhaR n=1 Tax=Marinicauda salina TaxID=2135793 RepID=A0A2U2BQT2_9PROT|nr:polyhydroxyalkanoate synthesis repressor PhaR [Marinicauda salina]PWE16338.1 polyhydroxyalkanoate synthesis repressor PhaR [Marinicauda salina]
MPADDNSAVVIKKYANRRLYDTSASRYVTLDHLRELVKANRDFQVIDAKTGEDLTRSVLAQIIFEEESKGANLLPVEFLRQLISFYGDSMQAFVPDYLRMSMETLCRQQDELRKQMTSAMGGAGAMPMLEEHAKRNMALFEQAMKMFTPFPAESGTGEETPAGSDDRGEVESLRAELEAMRAKIDKLAGDR